MAGGFTSTQYAELVDVFPTLLHAAAGDVAPRCGPLPGPQEAFCTEGVSLLPTLRDRAIPWQKHVAFSEIRRKLQAGMVEPALLAGRLVSGMEPAYPEQDFCYKETCLNGYSLVTRDANNAEVR